MDKLRKTAEDAEKRAAEAEGQIDRLRHISANAGAHARAFEAEVARLKAERAERDAETLRMVVDYLKAKGHPVSDLDLGLAALRARLAPTPKPVTCPVCHLALYDDAAKAGYCADHEPTPAPTNAEKWGE